MGTSRGWRAVLVGLAVVVVVVGLAAVLWRGDEAPQSTGEAAAAGTSQLRDHTYLTADDEVVCGTTSGGVVHCLDAATGEDRFTEQLNETSSGPVLVDDVLVVATRPGSRRSEGLFGYTVDGELVWASELAVSAHHDVELATAAGVVALPVDTVGVGTPLVGIDAATGEERWRLYDPGEGLEPAPGAPELAGHSVYSDGERFYVGLKSFPDLEQCVSSESEAVSAEVADACATGSLIQHVAAIDAASGTEIWRSSLPRTPDFEGLIDLGGMAMLEDGSALAMVLEIGPDRLVMLDRASGQLRWDSPLASNNGSVAHVDDVIVVTDHDRGIHGYDAAGTQLWSVPSPLSSVDKPANLRRVVAAGDRLYSVGFDLYEIDPANGTTRLVGPGANATDVAVVGDRLVVARRGRIQVVPVGTELPAFGSTDPTTSG